MSKTFDYQAIRFDGEIKNLVEDSLTIEEALSVYINSEPLTVTMQTPGNERELTRGLLYTEGIYKKVNNPFPFEVVEMNKSGHISKVNIDLPAEDYSVLNKRSLLSVSACGICGKKELEIVEGKVESRHLFRLVGLRDMFKLMQSHQQAFLSSGGCHSAAAFGSEGQLLSVMEDIGRHNAVDKVIGDLLFKNALSMAQILLVSGRVSYEIVTKTFIAGIPLLAAVSAPSSLAVDYSKELGITILGFCREERATVYSHPERIAVG